MTLDFDFIYNADNDIFEYLLRFYAKNYNYTLSKEENTYHGTITLQDIKNKKKEQIKLYATWDDHGEDIMVNPNEDPQPSDLLEVNFKAAQKKK